MTEAFICDLMYILHYFLTHCTRHNTETTPLHVGNDLLNAMDEDKIFVLL